jgi:hypothetical protein
MFAVRPPGGAMLAPSTITLRRPSGEADLILSRSDAIRLAECSHQLLQQQQQQQQQSKQYHHSPSPVRSSSSRRLSPSGGGGVFYSAPVTASSSSSWIPSGFQASSSSPCGNGNELTAKLIRFSDHEPNENFLQNSTHRCMEKVIMRTVASIESTFTVQFRGSPVDGREDGVKKYDKCN